ncbi:MAG: hypothetical protein ACK5QW_00710 [Cyanobacteriota bacterium]
MLSLTQLAEALTYRILELEERLLDLERQNPSPAVASPERRVGEGAREGGDRTAESAGGLARKERFWVPAPAEHAPIPPLRALSPPLDL